MSTIDLPQGLSAPATLLAPKESSKSGATEAGQLSRDSSLLAAASGFPNPALLEKMANEFFREIPGAAYLSRGRFPNVSGDAPSRAIRERFFIATALLCTHGLSYGLADLSARRHSHNCSKHPTAARRAGSRHSRTRPPRANARDAESGHPRRFPRARPLIAIRIRLPAVHSRHFHQRPGTSAQRRTGCRPRRSRCQHETQLADFAGPTGASIISVPKSADLATPQVPGAAIPPGGFLIASHRSTFSPRSTPSNR